ncbi:hypothetical protein EV127DRAFT_170991 [Xylaria flabelliformis]|nr:hypothetical protein EV127DRAFT_170991 [Xylaria flabelliformis]
MQYSAIRRRTVLSCILLGEVGWSNARGAASKEFNQPAVQCCRRATRSQIPRPATASVLLTVMFVRSVFIPSCYFNGCFAHADRSVL